MTAQPTLTHHDVEDRAKPLMSRRALAKGAAWAAPAAVVSVAAPALAVSPRCLEELGINGTRRERAPSGSEFAYYWDSVFAEGDAVRLHVEATKISDPGFITTNNLVWSGPQAIGGTYGDVVGAESALRLSVTTTPGDSVDTIVRYRFTVQYRASGSGPWQPMEAQEMSFFLADIEGQMSKRTPNPGHSAERGWLSPGPWQSVLVNPGYLTGVGSENEPWSRRQNSNPDSDLIDNNLGHGTVHVTSMAPVSEWDYFYGLDATGAGTGSTPINSNMWIASPSMTVAEPGCG